MLNSKLFPVSKYSVWYLSIINTALSQGRIKRKKNNKLFVYYEYHHILPKSLFPLYGNLNKNEWNGVLLTAREHYICHWLLTKIFSSTKMIVAFKRFHYKRSPDHADTYINSRAYEHLKKVHSLQMKLYNPMHNPYTVAKMMASTKKYWTKEMRHQKSINRVGVDNISDEGKEKLSKLWKGVSRPKSKEHIDNHRKSLSTGIYKTPFGDFYSPGSASQHENNKEKLSRYLIIKYCKEGREGFSKIDY